MQIATAAVSLSEAAVCSEGVFSCTSPQPLALTFFLCSSLIFGGGDNSCPFRAESSHITYSWHLGQLWFSVETAVSLQLEASPAKAWTQH